MLLLVLIILNYFAETIIKISLHTKLAKQVIILYSRNMFCDFSKVVQYDVTYCIMFCLALRWWFTVK